MDSFGDGELADYIIYFTRNMDPNGNLEVSWPQYDLKSPKALVFQDDPIFRLIVEDDSYRINPLEFVANLSLLHPI
jgi:carboxylesterase type B